MLTLILPLILPTAGAVLTGLVGLGISFLRKKWKLEEKEASANAGNQIIARIAKLAFLVVQDINSTLRPSIEAKLMDGKLTPEEGAALKREAVERIKQLLGTEGAATAHEVLGIGIGELERLIGSAVEAQLENIKRADLAVSQQPLTTWLPMPPREPSPWLGDLI